MVYFKLKIFTASINTIIFTVIIFCISYFISYIYIRIYSKELQSIKQGILELSNGWLIILTLTYSTLITLVCYEFFIILLINLANYEELVIKMIQITENRTMHNSYIDIIKDITTDDLTQSTETQGRKLTLGYIKLKVLLYLNFALVFWTMFAQSASILIDNDKKR